LVGPDYIDLPSPPLDMSYFKPKCTKFDPRSRLGSSAFSQIPLARFKEPTSKGEEKKGRGKGGEVKKKGH